MHTGPIRAADLLVKLIVGQGNTAAPAATEAVAAIEALETVEALKTTEAFETIEAVGRVVRAELRPGFREIGFCVRQQKGGQEVQQSAVLQRPCMLDCAVVLSIS